MALMKELYHNLDEIKRNDVLLDVRTAEEFSAFRIEGSRNISHDELGPTHRDELINASHIHVYCRRGGRAVYAAEVLKALDIDQITVYDEDGMEAWQEAGYPVVSG